MHLHEVGALDSIIDIVGAVHGMEWLGVDDVVVSPLNVGSGTVQCAHGVFPVPAPATAADARRRADLCGCSATELVTPTGALLMTGYASRFGPLPAMRVDPDRLRRRDQGFHPASERAPNAGRRRPDRRRASRRSSSLECEIDDMNPQLFGPLMDRLYEAGALDVFYAPVQMKKNRPGTLVTVLAQHRAGARRSRRCCSLESTTIGVRYREMQRERLEREMRTIDDAARGRSGSRWRRATAGSSTRPPEFEDCARVAADARRCRSRTCRRSRSRPGSRRASGRAEQLSMARFYLTTAIDYVNSRPHLGTAYEKIAADVIARYKRLAGFDTHFVMGNDEHSQNVFKKARELGEDPLALLRSDGAGVPRRLERLDISFDDFIRTTEPRHRAGVQELVQADDRRGRHLRRVLRRLVLRLLRGVQAGEGSRRRHCARFTGRSPTGSARRTTSSACRSISEPLLRALSRAARFL